MGQWPPPRFCSRNSLSFWLNSMGTSGSAAHFWGNPQMQSDCLVICRSERHNVGVCGARVLSTALRHQTGV